MTATRKEREDFIARLAKHGISPDDSRKILRYAATLDRLAVAQCNGDWPADNGDRKVVPCTRCEALWVRSSMIRDPQAASVGGFRPLICKDCRTADLARSFCERLRIEPVFGGDPRGCVLKLKIPGDRGNDFGGEGLVCVPS